MSSAIPARRPLQSDGKPAFNRREFAWLLAIAGAVIAFGQGEETVVPAAEAAAKEAGYGVSASAFNRARRRAEALIARMTIPERIGQLGVNTPAIKRLGVKPYHFFQQALHGLCKKGPVTSFPCTLALANTWNTELFDRIYTAVSDEARAWYSRHGGGLIMRSPPVVNMARDPRWGRMEETLGEDPCLTGTLAVCAIRAMQGNNQEFLKTAATAKHFLCYNTEDDRMTANASVDPRSFWEYHTRAFRACVEDGHVFSIMTTYNELNGLPTTANRATLTGILRDRWGFRGFVTSDYYAVTEIVKGHHFVPDLTEAVAISLEAGCDHGAGPEYQKYLLKALHLELVTQADINRALARVLTVRFLLGEFDPPKSVPYSNIAPSVLNSPAHQQLALQSARESIVLLKNDRHFLPWDITKMKSLAVIGPMADVCHLGGYSGQPEVHVSPLQGIMEKWGYGSGNGPTGEYLWSSRRGNLWVAPGCTVSGRPNPDLMRLAVDAAHRADHVILVCGSDQAVDREGHDREDITLPGAQHDLIKAVFKANANTVLVLSTNTSQAIVWEQEHLPAILCAQFAGQAQGTAIADVIFGQYNPGGKLATTWYASIKQLPPFHDYSVIPDNRREPSQAGQASGRTYMYMKDKPLYPFGFGLSYTTFAYSNLKLNRGSLAPGSAIMLSATVTNTGAVRGDEIVQCYIQAPPSPVVRPIKQLVGFARMSLAPGESRQVQFAIDHHDRALHYWDVAQWKFVVQPGTVQVLIGASSSDIRLRGEFALLA
jgi:beta-glucosidase